MPSFGVLLHSPCSEKKHAEKEGYMNVKNLNDVPFKQEAFTLFILLLFFRVYFLGVLLRRCFPRQKKERKEKCWERNKKGNALKYTK